MDVAAQSYPVETDSQEPFKVVYEAPKFGRPPQFPRDTAHTKFKYKLPSYDYDKVMSRVKPMMKIHDRPSLELLAQGRKENVNFIREQAKQAQRYRKLSTKDRRISAIPKASEQLANNQNSRLKSQRTTNYTKKGKAVANKRPMSAAIRPKFTAPQRLIQSARNEGVGKYDF